MQTYLRHAVHLCLIDEGAIFLDLSANAYLGIDEATKRALATCLVGLQRDLSAADASAGLPQPVAALLERGLLTPTESLGHAFAPLCVSMTHAVPFGTGRADTHIHARHVVLFLSAWLRASILIRRGHLLRLTARLMRLKARQATGSRTPHVDSAVALVHIARRLCTLCYSAKDACLLDSAVLAEFMIWHGYPATLILAVRTKPFLAHAWVQLGTQVLNDSLEHAQTLTPIAAL